MGIFNKRYWKNPRKRSADYAAERKGKVYLNGLKKGQPLSEYDLGVRSGYLRCQSDHTGIYKYKKALNEGKSPKEAAIISQQKGSKKRGRTE